MGVAQLCNNYECIVMKHSRGYKKGVNDQCCRCES